MHNKTAQSKEQPAGRATAVTAVTLSVGWIYLWGSGTWKLDVGKEPTDNGSSSAPVYQGEAAAEGALTAGVDDLIAGFRADRDSSLWKVTAAGFLFFCDGPVDTQMVTWGYEAVKTVSFAVCSLLQLRVMIDGYVWHPKCDCN